MPNNWSPFAPRAVEPLSPARAFPPFGALRALDALVRLGNVGAAADALSVNRSMINRHIRTLESWTGATLVSRDRNMVTLTEAGHNYYSMLAPHIEGIAEATLSLLEPRRDNRLSIWSMPGFATLWLMHRIAMFRDKHPNVEIELRAEEAAPDFSQHQADVAIRYIGEYGKRYVPAEGRLAEIPTNVRILELARVPLLPVASPEYLGRSAPIKTASDLLQHSLIYEDRESWTPWLAALGQPPADQDSGLLLWRTDLALNAARHGQGIALANYFGVQDSIVGGELVEVEQACGAFPPVLYGSYILIARPDRWVAPPVAKFRHWILNQIKSELGE